MSLRPPANRPAPLVVAASLVAVEGLLLLVFAVLEVASLDADRVAMGATTSIFFVGYAALLLLCAWSLVNGHSWARSPVVLTQLIGLGVAWSFRGGDTTAVSLAPSPTGERETSAAASAAASPPSICSRISRTRSRSSSE